MNGKHVKTVDSRTDATSNYKVELDVVQEPGTIEIFAEGMGHLNIDPPMENDRKGVFDAVYFNDQGVQNWEHQRYPLREEFLKNLVEIDTQTQKLGGIFKGSFSLGKIDDTYFDFRNYQKGVAFVNGINLGRFWNAGPQYRLYCPASYLKVGVNELVIMEQVESHGGSVSAFELVDGCPEGQTEIDGKCQ